MTPASVVSPGLLEAAAGNPLVLVVLILLTGGAAKFAKDVVSSIREVRTLGPEKVRARSVSDEAVIGVAAKTNELLKRELEQQSERYERRIRDIETDYRQMDAAYETWRQYAQMLERVLIPRLDPGESLPPIPTVAPQILDEGTAPQPPPARHRRR